MGFKRIKKLIFLPMIAALLCSCSTNQQDASNNGKISNVREKTRIDTLSSEVEVQTRNLPDNESGNQKTETNIDTSVTKWGFGMADICIDKQPILDISYEQLTKSFGIPEEIRTMKVRPPATEENLYKYFTVAVYKGIEFEFFTEYEKKNHPSNLDKTFRFDIIDHGIHLDCGLQVGMSVDEVISKFGFRNIYIIDEAKETYELNDLKNVLRNHKPDNYYSGYSKAIIIYADPQKFTKPTLAMALVLLIKDDKVGRIVFGYPTAG